MCGVRASYLNIVGFAALRRFGAGVDYAHVRVVVHVDPQAALFYLQESGRGGRDGEPYFSYVFWQKKPFLSDPDLDPHVGVVPMLDFLTTSSCRRLAWCDIDPHVHSCCAMNAERCDNCKKMSEVWLLLSQSVFTDNARFTVAGCAHTPRAHLPGTTRAGRTRTSCDDADGRRGTVEGSREAGGAEAAEDCRNIRADC